jgi:putative membrane protein
MKQIKYLMIGAFWIIAFSSSAFTHDKPKLTDSEIASAMLVANQIPIAHAKLAKATSTNEDVLKFAEMIIQDHMTMMSQLAGVNKKLNITPKDNHVSHQLFANASETKRKLSSQSGKSFDEAYINNQIAYHKAIKSSIQDLLAAKRSNRELNKLLQNLVLTINTHLEEALKIQNKIANV